MQPYLQYILLLGAVIIVFAMIMPRKKQQAAIPDQTVQNMETALEQFMENMEKDNQELAELVLKALQENRIESELKERRIAELERKYELLSEKLMQASLAQSPPTAQTQHTINAEERHQQPYDHSGIEDSVELPEEMNEEVVPSNTIHSRYAELFQLYEQGKSIEMISKKLGMNKGEVQLIIQLAKQEDKAHA